MKHEFALSYDTVYLIPEYSELYSRNYADMKCKFAGKLWKLPVVPANMQDVIDFSLAEWHADNGHFYIMHRFNDATRGFLRFAHDNKLSYVSVSVGTSRFEDELEVALVNGWRVDCITIDVAHAHHALTANAVNWIKKNFPKTWLIAGNVATPAGVSFLAGLGVDTVKVGIGDGSICTTRDETGFHLPTLQSLYDIQQADLGIPIIADGGMKRYGDIAKALVFGAQMTMSGGFFAGCSDSPAEFNNNGQKIYRGSTSYEAKGHERHIEGRVRAVKAGKTVKEVYGKISDALSSSISYAGGKDLSAFREVRWMRVFPKLESPN